MQIIAFLIFKKKKCPFSTCLSKFILQDATLSPELPLGQPRLETVDREGHSLPGEFFLPTKSMLDNNILFEKSIYDTTSKTSDKPPLTQRSFPHPALPTGQQSIDLPSSEKEDTLRVLPSALVPRITEGTSSPFLVDLGRETQTKAVPTATHTEQPSLLGFKTESPSGQGRS